MNGGGRTTGVRRAEIVGVLTAATELALGQVPNTFFRATLLSIALARRLGWSEAEMATLYWYSLLRFSGCHAENHSLSALIGDEVEFNRQFSLINSGNPAELLSLVVGLARTAHAARGPAGVEAILAASLPVLGQQAAEVIAGHCDVAQQLARRLGFEAEVVAALDQFRERWDGSGLPRGVSGERLMPAVRVAFLCQEAITLVTAFGRTAALEMIGQRAGTAYDPVLVAALAPVANQLLDEVETADPWRDVMDAEPGARRVIEASELDDACMVIADFCDLQLPGAASHSRSVASLAEKAGSVMGLAADDVDALRRASLLHDIGYAALPVRARGGYAQPVGATGETKLHPFHGEQILDHVVPLKSIAGLVGRHHEALDGSGFFRGLKGAALSLPARLLAAAEFYQTALEGRFGQPPLDAAGAASALRAEVTAGRLDPDAAKAILGAAGHRVPTKRRDLVAGLTNRELQILRLAATGLSMKEIGTALGISSKTVDNHLQHVYAKIDVRTRAGATLFAIEHGLCGVSI